MRWIFICLVINFFISSNVYAIRDYLKHPPAKKALALLNSDFEYPYSKSSPQISNDEYNFFYYTDHFRIIAGNYYSDFPSVKSLMQHVGEIAEQVWQKEIVELQFPGPRNSADFFIDIYIANKKAYNPDSEEYISISSYYAGYATLYSDGTPYFIINPNIGDEILKVTLAHEFFHTIQFGYCDFFSLDSTVFDSNAWWLEATAVWMESVVFPEVSDFVNFMNDWIRTSYYNLDLYNGDHEYTVSIVPVYLAHQNLNATVEFIRQTLKNFDQTRNFVQIIERLIPEYFQEDSLSEVLRDIAVCVVSHKDCLPYSDMLAGFQVYAPDELPASGYYSLYYFEADEEPAIDYVEMPFLSIGKVMDNKGVYIPRQKQPLPDIVRFDEELWKNSCQVLASGWNLVVNPYSDEKKIDELIDSPELIVWSYENATWSAWTNIEGLKDALANLGLARANDLLNKNQAFWLKSDQADLKFSALKSIFKGLTLEPGWNFISLGQMSYPVSYLETLIQDDFILWTYKDGEWQFYSNQESLNDLARGYGYSIIEEAGGINGYWIKLR